MFALLWGYIIQELANEKNITIIRIYGAAGHGKGIIDAMSSFGVKAILRQTIIGTDSWFKDSEEMVEFLAEQKKCDTKFVYRNIYPNDLSIHRLTKKKSIKIVGCSKIHLLCFRKEKEILLKNVLCNCENCLMLQFDKCNKTETEMQNAAYNVPSDGEVLEDEIEDRQVENEGKISDEQVYEFITENSFITVYSPSISTDPFFVVLVENKSVATEKLTDANGHVILEGEQYFEGRYLEKISESRRGIGFKIVEGLVYILPCEVMSTFVDVELEGNDYFINMIEYTSLLTNLHM